MNPTYTIAVANYNMETTLRQSLTSMLEQVNEAEYEVVVIDDSNDRSPEILRELSQKWDNLRVFTDCGNRNLAEARNMSFEKARGEYVLASLDTDNTYEPVIEDFTTVYHALEEAVDGAFFLSGRGINMGPRELLLDVPYRSLGYGEDRDYWRRLIARDAYVGFQHAQIETQIGYDRSFWEKFQVGFETMAVQFQSGMHLYPYLRWAVAETLASRTRPRRRAAAHVLLAPVAWWVARSRDMQYEAPEPFDDMSVWRRELARRTQTLTELEDTYDIVVDRNDLSERGRELLDVEAAPFRV